MADPNNNSGDRERDRDMRTGNEDDATRHFDKYAASLFGTLWSLPATIYQRGNEHGREFSRLLEERQRREGDHESRGEREEEQEREDGRGRTACGWRGRRNWQQRRGNEEEGDVKSEDWMKRVAEEVERNQMEARRLYQEYEKKVLAEEERDEERSIDKAIQEMWEIAGLARPEDHEETAVVPRHKPDSTWTDLFPAWSTSEAAHPHEDEPKSTDIASQKPQHRPGPFVSTAQQIEDALNAAHSDLSALMVGTSQIAKAMRDSYDREARIWNNEGLFGSHPLSKPLSTMFSLGMRPFMPTESAIGYLLFDEYSPLHLEEEAGFDASFRKRFEDLVRIQGGKDMTSLPQQESGSTKVEWLAKMSALLEEGESKKEISWPARQQHLLNQSSAVSDFWASGPRNYEEVRQFKEKLRAESDPEIEAALDAEVVARDPATEAAAPQDDEFWSATMQMIDKEMEAMSEFERSGPHTEEEYHEWIRKFNESEDPELEAAVMAEEKRRDAATAASPYANKPRPSAVSTTAAEASNILSTLTTTTRHVAADGTVVTKTVLKKRFADGREETESEETTQEGDPGLARLRHWQQERLSEKEREEQGSKIVREAKKGGGWFWSS